MTGITSDWVFTSVVSTEPKEVYNVAMLDGAVRSISELIDYTGYQALMPSLSAESDMPNLRYVLKRADYELPICAGPL